MDEWVDVSTLVVVDDESMGTGEGKKKGKKKGRKSHFCRLAHFLANHLPFVGVVFSDSREKGGTLRGVVSIGLVYNGHRTAWHFGWCW